MRILKRLINRGNLSTEKERKRMNRKEQIESFTKGLSKEELDSFFTARLFSAYKGLKV